MNDVASAADALSGQAEDAPAAPQETGNAPWYDGIEGDLRGWVENKGWKSQQDALNSAWNLEKMFGADRAGNTLLRPKEGDESGWQDLYNQLGRPETSSDYKYEVAENADTQTIDWFRDVAHKAGMSQDQFSMIAREFDGMIEGIESARADEFAKKSEQEFSDLKREWGLAYDANTQAAQRAAAKFGFTQEEISGIEQVVGTKAVMQKFAEIGKSFGEDQFRSGDQASEFAITPAAAQSQIGELQGDKQFMEAYFDNTHPGHKSAVEKMTKLNKAAYPG